MRDLFDQLIRDGEAGMQRLIDERAPETVTLDFKQKSGAAKGVFEKKDRQILGELLSGFANSAGGLGIWGVAAHKLDGIDCAQSLEPIDEIEKFQSHANSLVGQLIMPRHEGIRVEHIKSASTGAGYLLVLVDRSERRPHRSEASGEKQYFKRAGDSFFAMEHYDIEDAFRRNVTPEVNIVCDLLPGASSTAGRLSSTTIIFEISLLNTGSIIARFPYIQFNSATMLNTRRTSGPVLNLFQVGDWTNLAGGADHVIHVGQKLPMLRLETTVLNDQGRLSISGATVEPRVYFEIRGGCENVRQEAFQFDKQLWSLVQALPVF